MNPSSLLSYYPTYSILDEVLSYSNYKTLNIYIDLKNCLQSVYMKHAIYNIIEGTEKSIFTDTSVFTSILSFLSFHKIYSLKRSINIQFYIFFEVGQSAYHQNISKKYKISRRIDNLYGLEKEKRDIFFETLRHNYKLVDSALNRIPNTKVFRLEYLEADFIPYYLISRNLVDNSSETAHLVYSNDHDLLQTITAGSNVFVYQKIPSIKRIIKKNEVMKRELKQNTNLPDKLQPLAMSILGDSGDDVDGIKGIGPVSFMKLSKELISLVGDSDKLYDNVFNNNSIFTTTSDNLTNKHLKKIVDYENKDKIISNNLKLVSFELITRALEDPINTEMLEKRNHIHKIIENKNNIVPHDPLKSALEKNGVSFFGDELDNLYYGYQ